MRGYPFLDLKESTARLWTAVFVLSGSMKSTSFYASSPHAIPHVNFMEMKRRSPKSHFQLRRPMQAVSSLQTNYQRLTAEAYQNSSEWTVPVSRRRKDRTPDSKWGFLGEPPLQRIALQCLPCGLMCMVNISEGQESRAASRVAHRNSKCVFS